MSSILDVVDNYLDLKQLDDIRKLDGKSIFELGEEVRRFALHYTPPQAQSNLHPIYIGGWPSANFWLADSADLLMSSLLFCGQILVKDPISEWFSEDQYRVERLMSARPGFLKAERNYEPNIVQTRQFLSAVLPALRAMKPLIEAEIVILIPSSPFEYKNRNEIKQMEGQIVERISSNLGIKALTEKFIPNDIPLSDNVRGIQLFCGGNREDQVKKFVARSANFFASEYLLSKHYGFNYTAAFDWEHFVCDAGLSKTGQLPSHKVVQALLQTSLPVMSGLSPSLVAQLKDDENYSAFRQQLYITYKDIPIHQPSSEINAYIADVENALLLPHLDKARRDVESGQTAHMGIKLGKTFTKLGFGFILGDYLGSAKTVKDILQDGANDIFSSALESRGNSPISAWTKLYSHQRDVNQELRAIKVQHGNLKSENSDWWGIPENPSRTILIPSGSIIGDFMFQGETPITQSATVDTYSPCKCGSGIKYKFCCKPIDKRYEFSNPEN